jgi:hypothetical protein
MEVSPTGVRSARSSRAAGSPCVRPSLAVIVVPPKVVHRRAHARLHLLTIRMLTIYAATKARAHVCAFASLRLTIRATCLGLWALVGKGCTCVAIRVSGPLSAREEPSGAAVDGTHQGRGGPRGVGTDHGEVRRRLSQRGTRASQHAPHADGQRVRKLSGTSPVGRGGVRGVGHSIVGPPSSPGMPTLLAFGK